MKSPPIELLSSLMKDYSRICFLIEMSLDSTLRYTSNDIDLWYGGNRYYSRGITFSGAEYSMSPQVDRISIDLDNTDNTFTATVLNQEVRGRQCSIKLASLRSSFLINNGDFEFNTTSGWTFYVDSPNTAAASLGTTSVAVWKGKYSGLITINSGGIATDDIRVSQDLPINIASGHDYKLVFAAKATWITCFCFKSWKGTFISTTQ